ncbi:MAG: YscO family type III secretion system apparatus protein [Succinivibrio dextrinosolvens]|uniref:type III secretion system stalk subunit SctO n=1 Tax=Succinivibrio sp. TaxID=2053619 RepID=UPI0025F93A74|nr:YscO family type III secretion system apparatus protein [Succinivibrio sp.]MBQ9221010.1 YscO family type III secretion system apparatus protein [Succinivibrio sp.]MDY6419240.1 YscO family type III secretion system apparatus protein [Succinivibrio dextrinosolvens]MDY6469547.1 YscO family type III secretion system apparatus protein [Succinivibrio dextrinosolvens]
MAKYPLEKLIGLRSHRVDEAQRERMLAQKKVEQTQTAIKKKIQEIEDYKIWKEEETLRRYDKVMFKKLTSESFEKFKQDLANLNIGELKLQDELRILKNDAESLKQELKNKKDAEKKASVELNKIEEHKKIWLEMQRIEEERQEESELEDFHTRKIDF